MKKQLITLMAGAMLANLPFKAMAQMTLQHTYTDAELVQVVNLKLSGKKYCISDMDGGQVRLYNLDHSLWKTINFPAATGYTVYTGYTAQYVSENLFSMDNKVDLVLTYESTATPALYKNIVIDETGTIVKSVDTSQHVTVYNTGTDQFVAVFDMHVATSVYPTFKVYSLPGTIPCDVCGNGLGLGKSGEANTGGTISDPMPNPNNGATRIDYTIPIDTRQAEIAFYNTDGRKVHSYSVNKTSTYVIVDNSLLPPGIYYYNLIVDGLRSDSKKMLVIK